MSIYEEVEIEDLEYDPTNQTYTYPCPCGDKFRITLEELWDGEDIATCPSCTLRIMVIYDEEDLPDLPELIEEGGGEDDDSEKESRESKLVEAVKKTLTVSA
uniref:Diphthamide biosynthesis protein 3 n=1 Tax=Trieres chinensis TaxID=1514140 RepID=A0A7S2EGA0_TRICV|mmetsp:Transcript_22514/g.45563  ORF Transcript_22514/g.45563 Transcript_22514/m.45563 type:complete len:102 (+) Transcript_22514:91-396(+)|eukprot:CAMPEP_0183292164 /NCGR_PEP_ID=MMETSP0160_2-20130417/1325_1 /TAXON_ID=2839 ORGANISM="Odontella Sinensis, Strain Grunow 1884" /NCGR_SAMPLE_ID=MMETSP0160_2 /ASSEMBLY_ACC=CAM_ASM_000250 /LENGTH=101 /DNA_ID=CAMNT_0025453083 /DNA_START=61 /DNA_END=366 /DNA_ORIENTATION=+